MSPHRFAPSVGVVAAAVALLSAACSGPSPTPAVSSSPPSGQPMQYVVSLGDSYISGEGDRWAGNTDGGPGAVDALGPLAYAGPDGVEEVPGCHRADLPEVAVDTGRLLGENLACSGAETRTKQEGRLFKPGIDFYHRGSHVGQALALERFASTHEVAAIVLSIGGNDFNFGSILSTCLTDFVLSVAEPRQLHCSADPQLASYFTSDYAADVQRRIHGALANIAEAMRHAGSTPSQYRLIVQSYPSPLPSGGGFRYPETSAGRFSSGACPVFDRDATWANETALRTINDTVRRAVTTGGAGDVTFLDLTSAFVGHRLCERGAARLQDSGLTSWRAPGAADALEWVNQIYLKGVPWQVQESAHPNYWGTAAERNCLRRVLTQTRSRSASCVRDGTSMTGREPTMKLVSDRHP